MWFKLNVDEVFLDVLSTQFKFMFYTTEDLKSAES
jgi:hypothetical protein